MTELQVIQDGKPIHTITVEAEEKHGYLYCYDQQGALVIVIDLSKAHQ